MDAGNIIYIVAVIIYFIYTAVKKGKKNEDVNLPDQVPNEDTGQRPVSFEDLLKEIRGGQKERERDLEHSGQGTVIEERKWSKPVMSPEPEKYVTSADKLRKNQPENDKYGDYSGSISSNEVPKLKTLDEQVSINSSLTGLKVSESRTSKRKSTKNNRYQKMLSNPKSVRDAIILSEILNKKHF
ncbi:hypothetical protein MM236_14290 [Belliella sp. DSM 107340]|uniref:Uncharacterized protein n=1 Tax=Belliella calami TaxID=2923436 RepID=A0ABS9URB7_9BACT|nr:hypothetical protein [Belliella calami]MCH7399170.1 hypothetical protein [Belliella calami]